MTEIESPMPEGAALPSPAHTNAIENETVTEQRSILSNSSKTQMPHESMEVDESVSEKDDSQLSASIENGDADVDDLASKLEDTTNSNNKSTDASKLQTSTEDSKDAIEIDPSFDTSNTLNEVNLNSCNQPTTLVEAVNPKQINDTVTGVVQPQKLAIVENDGGKNRSQETMDETSLEIEKSSSCPTNITNKQVADLKDGKVDDMEIDEDPLKTSSLNDTCASTILQKENGEGNETDKSQENSIVDLGDDTDDDYVEVPKNKQHENTNGPNNSTNVNSSACSDSDGAVVIGSDSETDTPTETKKLPLETTKTQSNVIDDDDDDCVVIEDDTPAPASNDINKRKSVVLDTETNSDDSQPPNKKLRNATSPNMNQLTIKDARSLLSQELAPKRIVENAIYPVNITPNAQNLAQGPPKLVPVGSPAILPITGMSVNTNMPNNINLLPGLTDDMFVLEAPSFIVPYIYEKPPSDDLKNVVKEIETNFKFTKDDLAEADKSDDFDMITEQNKEDKDVNNTKKKKRRGGDDGDESWSEQSDNDEDDEDDEDSEGGMRTKVLIKEASDDLTILKGAIKPASAVVQAVGTNLPIKPGQDNYFESPLGKFFMDIGIGLVQEFVQSDLIRLQKRKMRKSLGKNITEFERAINALSGNLDASKKKNSPFKFTLKRCEFCNFKSESALAMANHYETPHMNGILYKCNFCIFEIRNATEIVYHMEAVHNIKARLIKPLPYHQCPNCGFEDNGKAKLARHQPVCAKKFRPELNLAPPNDWEAPAKIPRIKPRHGLVGTANAYQAMAAQAAAQKAALATIQQQQQAAQSRNLQAAAIAAQNAANKYRGRATIVAKPGMVGTNGGMPLPRLPPAPVRNPMATNVVVPNNYQLPSGQLLPNANVLAKKTLSGQPSISITPLPRQNAAVQPSIPSTSKMPPTGMKPGQSPTGNKTQFVICEICDGYIKDLEQLRNHMQWMHKVKIHPKMIYNRPPLNCQKCQFRFFTDQGLERHLLGSHGLVTSSMQEAANKGKDAGRCPVCGRMYQWKLLNHVSRDHHMTLKPAHLSYKCTVCTATFGMYKQFETHVYTAHSTVAKKAIDGKKTNAMPSGNPSSGNQRGVLSATNDSLLKPLKINDEITIIPQPASKPRITNMESHVID